MNKLTIIGNLTRDPELRTTTAGVSVCSFSVAVNRRKTQQNQDPGADYFNVSAWRQLGENCAKWLIKGRKVCVIGPVSVRMFTRGDGTQGASLEVTAEDVEFLSSAQDREQDYHSEPAPAATQETRKDPSGMTQVDTPDDLPF